MTNSALPLTGAAVGNWLRKVTAGQAIADHVRGVTAAGARDRDRVADGFGGIDTVHAHTLDVASSLDVEKAGQADRAIPGLFARDTRSIAGSAIRSGIGRA